MPEEARKKLIVGISGATGTILGVRLLQLLQGTDVETHLVVSRWGARTIQHESPWTIEQVREMATSSYSIGDLAAAIASGSCITDGMAVVPCSMKSLAAIAAGYGENLLHRAADVVLKERRKLVLVVRETPLSDIHLENMLKLSRMGAVIFPPVPAFYNHPETLDALVDHLVVRILDQFDIHLDSAGRWTGVLSTGGKPPA